MTLHIDFNYECMKCKANYIPYSEEICCPSCGYKGQKTFDYIGEAVESLKFNKADGSYKPGAWLTTSFGDHILSILFPIFDGFDKLSTNDYNQFSLYAKEKLDKMDWTSVEYLKEHVHQIAVLIYKGLMED